MKPSTLITAAVTVLFLALLLDYRHRSATSISGKEAASEVSPTEWDVGDSLSGSFSRFRASSDGLGRSSTAAPTSLFDRLEAEANDHVPIEYGRLEPYLEANHRSADSVLAAFRLTADRSLLQEALAKYPDDPKVALMAYYRAGPFDNKAPASAERLKWLDTIKRSDPGNALGDYLSAREHFKAGQTELAMQELQNGLGKTTLQDYAAGSVQAAEEAYRALGFSELEAKYFAWSHLPIPQLPELKKLGFDVAELVGRYHSAGDDASSRNTLQIGLALAQQIENSLGRETTIGELTGQAIERKLLGTVDPTTPYGNEGATVGDRLAEVAQQRDSLRALDSQAVQVLRGMSEAELISYFDRMKVFGSTAALRWAADRTAAP